MARGINKVILVGNLGNDPDVKYTQGGMAITRISLATTSVRKDKDGNQQERTEWHRVVIYQRLAEIAGEYLRKGSKVYIEGRLRTRKWQDQQGVERYTTEIIANELQMLDGRGEGQGAGMGQAPAMGGGAPMGQQGGYQQPAAPQQRMPQAAPAQGGYAPQAPAAAAPAQGGYQQRPAQGGFQNQGNFNQPQGGFNQAAPQQRGPMEPPIDFDDDIPF